ncbi:MAG TPA: phosphoadenylyl-sulfate reductase [Dysgonamonadaceae bacterium]|nr:phosphoadenylyl-sulfate reductase [Dysgonamonadaceae bacterium]
MENLEEKFQRIIKNNVTELSMEKQIRYLSDNFNAICFSTSFSYEDQVISFVLKKEQIKFFTLDTGRLFEETYDTWNRTLANLKIRIDTYYPDQQQLQRFVSENGPDSFYKSIENRKQCCYIRKVVPLKRALKGQEVWITGLRAEHSPNRENLDMFEWDKENKLIKYHPLLNWSTEEVTKYIKENNIPYNYLHKKNYVSIGCAPCTRAIKEGEDFRAGRWWWEDQSKKECGLHVSK